MLGSDIEWKGKAGRLTSDRGDVDDPLRIGRACFANFAILDRVQPARYRQLGCPDGMCYIDVEDGIMPDT